MEERILKKFLAFQILAFELGVADSHNLEYVPSDLNVLTDNPKISLDTRGDIFEINFQEIDEKT